MQNDMRDRLVELIRASDILCDSCGENSPSYCAEAIVNYLIANGVMLQPCKIGEILYLIQVDYKGKYSMLSCLVDSKITMLSIMRAYEEKTVVYMSTDKNKAEQKLKKINI